MFSDIKIGDEVTTFDNIVGAVSKVSSSYFIVQFQNFTKYYDFKGYEICMLEDTAKAKEEQLSKGQVQNEQGPKNPGPLQEQGRNPNSLPNEEQHQGNIQLPLPIPQDNNNGP